MIMLRSINIRSFLIGGLLVFSVMCLLGAANYVLPQYHGRFQIDTNQDYAFVLDSATGQVWSHYFPHDSLGVITGNTEEFHAPKLFVDEEPNATE
jgi:hypothetical protein